MALTISLSLSIASTRTSQTLVDGTVYGTGGNPVRSACRVFAKGYKVDYENVSTELTTTGNDSDPESDSSWIIDYTIDGFYKYNFVIVTDEYSGGDTYDIYDAVHDGGNVVYRSKANGNVGNALSNTVFWEVVDDPSSLASNKDTATESLNITSTVYLRVLSATSQYTFANLLSEQCLCTDCDEDEALRNYNIFAQWLDAVAVADSRSEVMDGELICRRIQSKFIDC